MEAYGSRIDTSGRFAIDFRFQPIPERLVLLQCRPLHIRWRHHAGAQLAYDSLPQLRVITHGGEIQLRKRKVRRFRSIVMARHAILIEQRALLRPSMIVRSTLTLRHARGHTGRSRRVSADDTHGGRDGGSRRWRLRTCRLPRGDDRDAPDNHCAVLHRQAERLIPARGVQAG